MSAVFVDQALGGARLRDVQIACTKLHVSMEAWRLGERLDRAPLLFAPLAAGARRIPDRLLEGAAACDDDATLVLLADEPLTLPIVTLQRGRLVLVAPNGGETRVEALLRTMLGPRDATRSRERVVGHAWTAETGNALRIEGTDATIVPFVEAEEAQRRIEAARGSIAKGDLRLEGVLGEHAGVLQLRGSPREWTAYWPRADRALFVHSPVRLPAVVDLAAVAGRAPDRMVRMPARSGDVAIAIDAAIPGGHAEIAAILADGGALALDRISSLPLFARARGAAFAEVR